jgi:WD40 repeat protein/serine/threonine protein kinase
MTSDPLPPGRVFGDFVVEDRIGEGSHGLVYRARQPHLDRLAAIKVLRTRLHATSEATNRFLREARTASSLDHPYAAHIYSSGAESDGTLWIAMEYVRGTPFSSYLQVHGPLSLDRFVPFLERVCEVVHSAHEQGIVHRDLKPGNIMVLSRAGRLLPKLLDFGVAKAIALTVDGAPDAETDEVPQGDSSSEPSPTGTPTPASHYLAATLPSVSGGLDETAYRSATRDALSPDALISGTPPDPGELTQRGQLIGSPAYMAPEQWDDAASVDARCDIYALGVLAYEALTGTRPFPVKSLHEIAKAHRESPPPPVPESLPAKLNAVFSRALAKAPDERFEDALTLASAFRRASGLGDQRVPLPHLDERLRERYVADAPQPLADAVATLDAARELRQARDAIWAIVDTLAHYLGLLALCARSRFRGPGGAAIPPALRRAGVEILSASDWLDIAAALTQSDAERPELHPVPELASLFTDRAAAQIRERFRLLWRLRERLASAAASDDELRERLGEAIFELSALLERAEFVCDYPIALPGRDGRAAAWTGVSRARQVRGEHLDLRGQVLRPGKPALLDAEGAAVLTLAPLVQVIEPSPGAPPELFMFAGGSGRGGKLVAMPLAFELRDPGVLDWLRLQLDTTFETKAGSSARQRAPYRGLEAYAPDDASLYVGREREVDGFINRLRLEPLLAVVGPSGAGKSSFVQAGVLAAMREADRHIRAIVVRPGPAPLSALTSKLVATGLAASGLGARLVDEPALLGELLREDAAARGPIVVVVDQFEELFTLTHRDEELHSFAAALAGAARFAGDPVRVILTLRDDYLAQAEALPALRERLAQGLKLLTTPGPEELERILVEPAERVGYSFEDPELPARMVEEVKGEPGALALLSFTAAKLWEARDRHFRRLPSRAYDALGGVGGALAHHAEALLEELPQAERRLIREAFRLLVTSEGTRAVLGRIELIRALGSGLASETVVEHLITGRLLVVSDGESGEQIEVAHEALLSAWPRLVRWRREDAEGARLRDQLRAAAVHWDRRDRPKGLLWRDDALAEYRIWRARYPGALTEVEEDFGRASLADARRGQTRRRALVASAFVALSVGLAVLFVLHQRAEDARAALRQQLLDSYLEQGSQALRQGRHHHALLFLTEAYRLDARGPEIELMLTMAAAPFEAKLASARHPENVWEARFSPDGDALIIATSAGIAYLRDGHDGRLRHELRGHDSDVFRTAWHPSGARVATGSFDGTIRVWDAESGELVRVLEVGGEWVFSLAFDRSGSTILGGSVDGRVRIFRDGEHVATIDAHRGPVHNLAVDPRGGQFATGGGDGHIRLWDVTTGEPRGDLPGHGARIDHLAFDASGARLLSTSMDGTARVFDVATGEVVTEFTGHRDRVYAGSFSPGGDRVATAGNDGSARIWDAETGRELAVLEGHEGLVVQAAFRGDEVLTAGADGTARRWDARTGALLAIMPAGTHPLRKAHFSPDGTRIATYDHVGKVALWSAASATYRTLEMGSGQLTVVRYSGDGSRLVTASSDGGARIFHGSGELVGELAHADALSYADLDATASRAVTVDESGRVHLWELGAEEPARELGEGHRSVDAARFGPGGETIFVAGEVSAVWDAATGRRLVEIGRDVPRLVAPGFTRDGTRLLAGASSGAAFVFEAERGEVVHTLTGHTSFIRSVRSSPGSEIAVTASQDGTARLWDLETGEAMAVLADHVGRVWDADFSPDGAIVATAGDDQSIRLWGVGSGRQLARLLGHTRAVTGVAFAPDGAHLASSSEDGTARLWSIPRSVWNDSDIHNVTRCLPLKLRDGNPAPVTDLPDDC